MSESKTSDWIVQYKRKGLSDRAKLSLEELKGYISDLDIINEPFSGLYDQYMMEIIDDNELAEIVERYRRIQVMYEKGLFVP